MSRVSHSPDSAYSLFVPCQSSITFPEEELAAAPRLIDLSEPNFRTHGLENDEALKKQLINIITWSGSGPIPLTEPIGLGRSIFVHRKAGHVYKLKGPAGIAITEDGLICLRPRHGDVFSEGGAKHVHWHHETYEPIIILGDPKAMFSLTAEKAEQEFDCHLALSADELAFPPTMCGAFLNQDGTGPEVDRFGKATGFSVIQMETGYTTLDKLCTFYFIDYADRRIEPAIIDASPEKNLGSTSKTVYDNFTKAACLAARSKMEAMLKYGLSQHAGTLGNFHAKSIEDTKAKVSDLDSCVLLAPDDPRRATTLLSNTANDMLRTLSQLSFQAFSGNFLKVFLAQENNPFFVELLSSYWGQFCERELIVEVANHLQGAYRGFLVGQCRHFASYSAHARSKIIEKRKGQAISLGEDFASWQGLHHPVLPLLLMVNYRFLTESKGLEEYGVKKPTLDYDKVWPQFLKGMKMSGPEWKRREE